MVVMTWGLGAVGIEWVQGRDASKHPPVQQTDPTTKHYPGRNVNRAEIEEPWVKVSALLLALHMKWNSVTCFSRLLLRINKIL